MVEVPDLVVEEDPEAKTFKVSFTAEGAERTMKTDLLVIASILDNY